MKKLVYVCSPLRGDIEGNIKRANEYCKSACEEGVVALAPHTIFTQFLNDLVPEERTMGLNLGLDLLKRCDELWVYGERISEGMHGEIKLATEMGMKILYKDLP